MKNTKKVYILNCSIMKKNVAWLAFAKKKKKLKS